MPAACLLLFQPLLSHRLLRASSATDAGGSYAQSVLDGCGLTDSEQVRLRASFGSARALRSASLDEIGAVLGEGSSADPTRVLSRLRSRPEPSDVGFHASLAGHPSAVQALALSGSDGVGDAETPVRTRVSETQVAVKRLSRAEIDWYLASDEWQGKAGGYSIQGRFARFIPWINGSYTNVVGLDLADSHSLLSGAGMPL